MSAYSGYWLVGGGLTWNGVYRTTYVPGVNRNPWPA